MKYIGDIKNISPIEITYSDDMYKLKSMSTKWKIECTPEEFELIKLLFDVHEEVKPLSKVTLRNKMVQLFPVLKSITFVFFVKIDGKKHIPERSFFHLSGNFEFENWNSMVMFMRSMYSKGIIDYLRVNGNIINFSDDNAFEVVRDRFSTNIGSSSRISFNVGIKSLKFFSYHALSGMNGNFYKIEGDYSYYKSSNSVICMIHNEIENMRKMEKQ